MKIRILSIYALLVAGCGGGGSTDPLVNTGVQGVDDICLLYTSPSPRD